MKAIIMLNIDSKEKQNGDSQYFGWNTTSTRSLADWISVNPIAEHEGPSVPIQYSVAGV